MMYKSVCIFMSCLGVFLSACAFSSEIPPDTRTGKIAFASNRSGMYQIYVMNANGSMQQQLTHSSVPERNPVWSPDGTKLAFVSEDRSSSSITIMDADGRHRRSMTTAPGALGALSWSPDGSKIVFIADHTGNNEIYMLNVRTSKVERLTNTSEHEYASSWFNDNTHVLFSSTDPIHRTTFTVYVLDTTTRDTRKIMSGAYSIASLKTSPDGKKIAYSSDQQRWHVLVFTSITQSIYMMNADGTSATQCTFGAHDGDPTWSANGAYVAFSSYHGAEADIYLTTPDCTALQALTTGSGQNVDPAWSP